jgi:hypothetical protein
MSSRGLIRFWNRKAGVGESEIESVLPRDNQRMASAKTVSPIFFLIQATAEDQSLADSDKRVLLGIKRPDQANEIQQHKHLRWM